jgi:hypothetical protein
MKCNKDRANNLTALQRGSGDTPIEKSDTIINRTFSLVCRAILFQSEKRISFIKFTYTCFGISSR